MLSKISTYLIHGRMKFNCISNVHNVIFIKVSQCFISMDLILKLICINKKTCEGCI